MAEQEPNFLEEIKQTVNNAGLKLSDQAMAYLASLPPTVSDSKIPVEDGIETTRPSQDQWERNFKDFPDLALSALERRALSQRVKSQA